MPLLANKLGEKEIYIIFGGPSLKGFDFSKLNGKFTLGCNRAAFDAKCDAIISIDNTFINSNKGALKKWGGIVALGSRETNASSEHGMRIVDWIEPDYLYWRDSKNPSCMSEERGVLCGANTGHAAINFAILEGFEIIHCLGLDLNYAGWWHGGGKSSASSQWLRAWARNLDACKNKIDSMGVRVINYNPNSAVRAFEFGDVKGI